VPDHVTAPTLLDLLTAGLHWLYNTEQPASAITSHHSIPIGALDNRRYAFGPASYRGHCVVVVDIIDHDFDHEQMRPRNVLRPGELADLAGSLTALGADVGDTWNGHPGTTGSIGLRRPAHPSLTAAVDLYSAGCPDHRSVLCHDCTWYGPGNAVLVQPRAVLAELVAASA
jgi:hypothetical protein